MQVAKLTTLVYTAAHQLIDKAGMVVCEDLTSPIARKRSYGKTTNRRLNTWTKGLIASAVDAVSQRRCSTLHVVIANGLLQSTGCYSARERRISFTGRLNCACPSPILKIGTDFKSVPGLHCSIASTRHPTPCPRSTTIQPANCLNCT